MPIKGLPLVSVIIPSFKQAEFLPLALKSVLEQSFTDWECLIVDDGSPDNTKEIAAQFINTYPERDIRLVEKRNGGLSNARNTGFRAARGRYFLPLDADDALLPGMLEASVRTLETRPEAAIAYSHYVTFGTRSEVRIVGPLEFPRELYENRLMYCALFRREVFDSVGGYAENLDAYEDWDFWISAIEKGWKGCLVDERQALIAYRIKESSMFSEAQQRHEELIARIRLNHSSSYPAEEVAQAQALISSIAAQRPPLRKTPLVSVVIPCYEQACFLPEVIESLVGQTFVDWEALIVDDGSPDNTVSVARSLIGKYHSRNIRLLSKKNGGLADARNWGVLHSRGRYILPLDADDKLQPSMLQKCVDLLNSRPDLSIAYTDVQHFGERSDSFESGKMDIGEFAESNSICATSLYRREVFDAVGGYRINLPCYEDWDFWLTALEAGFKGERIPEPLFLYRKSETSMLTRGDAARRRNVARIVSLHPHLYEHFTRKRAEELLKHGADDDDELERKAMFLWGSADDPAMEETNWLLVRAFAEAGWSVSSVVTSRLSQIRTDAPILNISGLGQEEAARAVVEFLREHRPTVIMNLNSAIGYLTCATLCYNAPECRLGEAVYEGFPGLQSIRSSEMVAATSHVTDFMVTVESSAPGRAVEAVLKSAEECLGKCAAARSYGMQHYVDSLTCEWSRPAVLPIIQAYTPFLTEYIKRTIMLPPEGGMFLKELFMVSGR